MTRIRLLDGHAHPSEQVMERGLRPRTLSEYIGQKKVIEQLAIAVEAARQRDEPLDHVLLYGPPGLGKTTLAYIIAQEMGSQIITTSGPAVERPGDLIGMLTNLQKGDVLFIDEIHRLNRVAEEFLYPAMEDFKVDFVVDRGAFAKTIQLKLQQFTLVGATTRAGALTSPLRERFGLFYHLDFYSVEELQQITLRSASILNVPIEPEAAAEIARRSRGTPRIANRLLKRTRDYAQVKGDGRITMDIARQALLMEGIDQFGLDKLDRRFLEAIVVTYGGGPVGIEALAATLNEEVDTLTEMVEPFLLKQGYIVRTPSGRKTTAAAIRCLQLAGQN